MIREAATGYACLWTKDIESERLRNANFLYRYFPMESLLMMDEGYKVKLCRMKMAMLE